MSEIDALTDEIRTLRDEILGKLPAFSSGEALTLATFLVEKAHPEINWDHTG